MLWIYLVDPKDHILKVLCCYLYCLLSYNGFLIKLLTSERREREEREERERREREERERGCRDFSGCLAECKGWAKGYGWARVAQ